MITLSSTTKKEPLPPLVRIRDVAEILSISRVTVHSLIDNGELKAEHICPKRPKTKRKHLRVTRESLLIFYKKRFGHHLNRALINPFET